LEQLIDAARVIVVPSEWYENGPYAVIEAFARARPVVASRIGGLPELVADGVNGMTYEPGSADQLAETSLRLLDDDALWLRLADGAKRTVAARDGEAYVVELEGLYSELDNARE
jgi:glycosyltransferase involved in cell wall biosynthesis